MLIIEYTIVVTCKDVMLTRLGFRERTKIYIATTRLIFEHLNVSTYLTIFLLIFHINTLFLDVLILRRSEYNVDMKYLSEVSKLGYFLPIQPYR